MSSCWSLSPLGITAHYFRCEWYWLQSGPNPVTLPLALSIYSIVPVKFIYFIGSRGSSGPALFACHTLSRLSVTRRLSLFSRVRASSAVRLLFCHWSLWLSVKRALPWDWASPGAAFLLAVPVSLWEADSSSCSRSSSRPFIQFQGRKEELLEPHVSLPVCCKTVLLCDSLGLFSWFCGRWEVRLESLELQPVFWGVRGAQGRWCKWFRKWSVAAKRKKGGAFLSCVIKDSSLRLLATTGLT